MALLIVDDHLFLGALLQVFDECSVRNGSVECGGQCCFLDGRGDFMEGAQREREREGDKERFCLVEKEASRSISIKEGV